MATLERGKGKRKQVIEIVRHGVVLRMQETDGGDARLPGYRRFPDEKSAGLALVAEVRAYLADGMQPADEESRALVPQPDPSKADGAGSPKLPLRQDLGIYNEATGFVVTSRKMAGKTLDEGSPEWKKAVTRGDMLPMELVQDDPFVIRVVAGEPLTAQEEEEWIARVDWHLNVPDGKLCVTGGSVFTNEDYEKDDPYAESFVGQVALPKGRYRATLYTFVHGVNGGSVLDHLAGGYDKGEDLQSWFARTRPGENFETSEDVEFVDFLIHLDPVDAAPKTGLSILPNEGWFGGYESARKPERCPRGLAGRDVLRRLDIPTPGKWTFVRHVFEDLPKLDRALVKGDPVSLPLESISRAARIAWFGSRFTVLELRLTAPAGSSIDVNGTWPEGVVAVGEDGIVRILFNADLDMTTIISRLPELSGRLAAMPDGTVLDLCSIALESMPGRDSNAGLLSLRGPLRNGSWRIAQSYPAADAATLQAALSLAAEVEGAGHEAALARIAVFVERFGNTFPAVKLMSQDGPDKTDDEDGDGLFPTKPIKGAEIFVAPSGRGYYQTMAMLVSEKVGTEVPKRERGLISSGFKHIGDLMCSADEDIGVRGYARPDGHTWAFMRVSAPETIELEIVSFAANGSIVVTSVPGATSKELVAHHDQRIQELGAEFVPRQPVALKMRGFAEALEARSSV